MDDIIREVCDLGDEPAALASLVWSSGSIPMSDRAKMLVTAGGRVAGTIGGGCLEAELIATAREVIESGNSHLTRYTMTEKQAGESGLNCGGSVRIYTESVAGSDAVYARLAQAIDERCPCAVATLLTEEPAAGSKRLLVLESGATCGTLGKASLDRQILEVAEDLIGKEGGRLFEIKLESVRPGGQSVVEVFVEPFAPPPQLLLFGGGHVGAEICRLAKGVSFEVVVIDDRPMFANQRRHPLADRCIAAEVPEAFATLGIDEQSYVVAATRGHQHDEEVLRQAIRTPARYIGMLGSERKKMLMWKKLESEGGDRGRLDQVFAPIGVNIGADTPEEIAVSVVAELIRVRRGVRKRWKTKLADPRESVVGG